MTQPITGQFEARPATWWQWIWGFAGQSAVAGDTPIYSGKDINGQSFQSLKLRRKVVALVFCGSWCKPCQWEVPTWNDINRSYNGKGLMVLGISMDTKETLVPHVANMRINYRMVVASSAMLWDFGVYPTGRIPVLALMNKGGVMVHRELGYHTKNYYESLIEPLL